MKKTNFLDTVTVNDYKTLIKNSYMDNHCTLLGFEKVYDADGVVQTVKLAIYNKLTDKKSIIKLTQYSCSNGQFENDWMEFVKGKVGEKNLYSSLLKQAKSRQKASKTPVFINEEFNA